MKEYTYEVEQSWEQQQRPPQLVADHHHHHHRVRHAQQQAQHQQQRQVIGDDAGMDADASSMSGMYNKHFYSVASFLCLFKA